MRYFIVFLCLFFSISYAQTGSDSIVFKPKIKGTVLNEKTLLPMINVHILNTTKINGTITNGSGLFEIEAVANDTLLVSSLGFETLKVIVTNDWIKNNNSILKLTEKIYVLNDIVVYNYKLTGYLEVDAKLIPVNDNYLANIEGLKMMYEIGDKSPSALTKVIGSVLNPIDFLYNTFSRKSKQMKKLKQLKADDEIRNLLATKFDRITLSSLLELDINDIPIILEKCNYSDNFIKTANDLQVLDAINSCYEEHKILNK